MKFVTRTGSIYEIDSNHKHVRKVGGGGQKRLGGDGNWYPYDHGTNEPVVGYPAFFTWPKSLVNAGMARSTVTSLVTSILEA